MKTYPAQRRDKSGIRAVEIVCGDGLKFDSTWVDWGDGEVINTSTGWFWQDVRTGYIMAYRLAQTETMDLFRLATYDLTGICLPRVVQVDNTMVAACKAMTGGMKGRKRGKDRPGDPEGLLKSIGVERIQWTNPDKVTGNPGAKPIERSFGIGGIHKLVRTNSCFHGHGYSKKTAVTPNRRSGEISIQAAPGALGRLRYWSPELARYKGRQLTALEAATLTPKREGVQRPEPGMVAPNFNQRLKVASGAVAGPTQAEADPAAGRTEERNSRFNKVILKMGERFFKELAAEGRIDA